MQSVPAPIQALSKTGPFAYAIEITPRSGDAWAAMRYASYELGIDGNTFVGGYLKKTSRVQNSANIRQAGASVTKDAVSFDLIDKRVDGKYLHETFIENGVLGRRVNVWLAPAGFNKIKNSSFERYGGSPTDFEEWTENTPGAGSIIGANTGNKTHGSASLYMIYGGTAPAPKVTSNTFTLKKGEYFSLSIDAKGNVSGDQFHVCIVIDGKYWNFTTKELQVGYDCAIISTTTSWKRYNIESLDWSQLGLAAATLEVDAHIILEVADSGDLVYFDGVHADSHPDYRAYVPHRDDLLSEDILKQYTGEVRSFDWPRATIKVQTNSILDTYHKDIPVTILTDETNSNWNIPPDNNGLPFPMTYGNLMGAGNIFIKWLPFSNEIAFGLLVNDTEGTDRVTVHFDRPGMKLRKIEKIHHYVEAAKKFIQELYDDRTTPIYVDYEWDKFADDARATADANAGWLPESKFPMSAYVKARALRTPIYTQFTNPTNAFDNNESTYASTTISGAYKEIRTAMDNIGIKEEGEIYNAYVLMDCELTDTSGDCWLNLRFFRPGASNITIIVAPPLLSSSASFNNIPWTSLPTQKETALSMFGTDASSVNEIALKKLGVWVNSADSQMLVLANGTNGSAKVWEMGFRVDFVIDLYAAVIAASVEGREYQDTWGGRKTAGLMIASCADIAESVLRDELAVPGSEINTTKFDAAYSSRSAWAGAGQLLKTKNSEQWFDEFCGEFGMLYYIDLNAKHALKALDHGAADVALKQSEFLRDSIKPSYTERELVYNRFVIKYDYNPVGDYFTKSVYCNKNASSFTGADATEYEGKCDTSYQALGDVEHEITVECKWIHTETTALKILKWLIDWNYLQRLTVEGTVFMEHAGIEVGDLVSLDIPDYIPHTITDSAVFIVEKTRTEKDRAGVYLSMFEVKEP